MVGKIKDNAILGMPLLVQRKCKPMFQTHDLEVEGGRMMCVDSVGKAQGDRIIVHQVTCLPAREIELPVTYSTN